MQLAKARQLGRCTLAFNDVTCDGGVTCQKAMALTCHPLGDVIGRDDHVVPTVVVGDIHGISLDASRIKQLSKSHQFH